MTVRTFMLTLSLTATLWAGSQPRTLVCNFDGENGSKVYRIVTAVGVEEAAQA